MAFTIQVRAVHAGQGRTIEHVIETCPAFLGRDEKAAVVLDGDASVSKIHASLDVRQDRLVVRDVRSTNGVFTKTGRLEPDRWSELGSVDEECELRIGGWQVYLRARRSAVAQAVSFAGGGGTVIEPIPFGATEGEDASDAAPVSIPERVERLREPVQAVRDALAALERAVAREVRRTPEADRAELAGAMHDAFAELRENAEVEALAPTARTAKPAPIATPETTALTSVQGLARWYVAGDRVIGSVNDVHAFDRRLREGIDALVLGIVQALAGLDTYVQQLHIADPAGYGYPRTASAFARALFDWRREPGEGAAIVRRAFQDLSVHQLAFFTAVCAGIRALLQELAPESIEALGNASLERRSYWRRLMAWWTGPRQFVEAYRRRHGDLVAEESARFELIFGQKFADEYRAFVRETRSQTAPSVVRAERGGTQVMPLVK